MIGLMMTKEKKMKSEITYEIYKNEYSKEWVLREVKSYVNSENGTGGISSRGIFSGTKKECQEKKKELMKSERASRKIRKA